MSWYMSHSDMHWLSYFALPEDEDLDDFIELNTLYNRMQRTGGVPKSLTKHQSTLRGSSDMTLRILRN